LIGATFSPIALVNPGIKLSLNEWDEDKAEHKTNILSAVFGILKKEFIHIPFKGISDVIISTINPFIEQGLKSDSPISLEN